MNAFKFIPFLLILLFPVSVFAELPATLTTYKLAVSKSKAQAKLDQGIEGAVEDMNFIFRPIARSRLKSTNEVYSTIGVKQVGDKISIQYASYDPIVKTNGRAEKWTRKKDGEVFTVTHKYSGNVLTQKFVAEDGTKTMTYVFSKDGKRMNITIQLDSEKLPKPMKYRLSYTKQ